MENRGFHAKQPHEVAYELSKEVRAQQAAMGAPADRLLRLPDPGGDMGPVWQKLGRPVDAKGYDLSGVKFATGEDLGAPFVEAFQKAAFDNGLPAAAAQSMAKEFAKFIDGQEASENATRSGAIQQSRDALKANWGGNFEANMFIAKQAATALGVTPEQVASLENAVGYDKVMDMFRNIGTKIGEDKYVAGTRPSGSNIMTRDQAVSRLTELKRDDAWQKRLLAGDNETLQTFKGLTTLIAGGNG
jgi:hypothetical protein